MDTSAEPPSSSMTERPEVRFLVVGTPRSGTTLVQRLACEIPGVGMPPETHFFTNVARSLIERRRFPLSATDLRAELDAYAATEARRDTAFDPAAVQSELGGRCTSPMALFDAIARQLTGPVTTLGEKTPLHLSWWRPLTKARPTLQIIAVIRDPRAVVSSNLASRWAPRLAATYGDEFLHLLFAQKWLLDEQEIDRMVKALGPNQALVLRYEDVAGDPQKAREAMARFLGLPSKHIVPGELNNTFVQPWETWKQQALGPVDVARTTGWKVEGRLAEGRAQEVAALAWPGMRRRGYETDSPLVAARAWLRVGVPTHRRLRGLRADAARERARLEAITL